MKRVNILKKMPEMISGLHEEWKHRAKTMNSDKNANETVNFNVQTIHVRNEIVKFAYDTDAIFNFIHRNTQYKPQKISFQALSSEILFPEYVSSGWIEELDPLTRQDWGHSRDEILIIYFEPFQFFFIQDGKHRYVEAQKFNKQQIFDAYIISSDCCVDAILNTEGKLLYRIFKDVQYYCQLCNI